MLNIFLLKFAGQPQIKFYQLITNNISTKMRIIGVLFNKPVLGIGPSYSEGIFVTICLVWGIIFVGTIQVPI